MLSFITPSPFLIRSTSPQRTPRWWPAVKWPRAPLPPHPPPPMALLRDFSCPIFFFNKKNAPTGQLAMQYTQTALASGTCTLWWQPTAYECRTPPDRTPTRSLMSIATCLSSGGGQAVSLGGVLGGRPSADHVGSSGAPHAHKSKCAWGHMGMWACMHGGQRQRRNNSQDCLGHRMRTIGVGILFWGGCGGVREL